MNVRLLLAKTPDAGTPLRSPLVIASADDYLVKYSRRDGWTCNCDTEGDQCGHVDAVAELLDPRVIGATG